MTIIVVRKGFQIEAIDYTNKQHYYGNIYQEEQTTQHYVNLTNDNYTESYQVPVDSIASSAFKIKQYIEENINV